MTNTLAFRTRKQSTGPAKIRDLTRIGDRPPPSAALAPIIAHSHLRWDFVWQRPQQIFSRLALTRPVLFVEEPCQGDGSPRVDISEPMQNVLRRSGVTYDVTHVTRSSALLFTTDVTALKRAEKRLVDAVESMSDALML